MTPRPRPSLLNYLKFDVTSLFDTWKNHSQTCYAALWTSQILLYFSRLYVFSNYVLNARDH